MPSRRSLLGRGLAPSSNKSSSFGDGMKTTVKRMSGVSVADELELELDLDTGVNEDEDEDEDGERVFLRPCNDEL